MTVVTIGIEKVKVGDKVRTVEGIEFDDVVAQVSSLRDSTGNRRIRIEFEGGHSMEADSTADVDIEFTGEDIGPESRIGEARRQVDPIADFRYRGIVIDAQTADALGHHLANSLQSVEDPNPDTRKRAIRRLRALVQAIRESNMRESEVRDVV